MKDMTKKQFIAPELEVIILEEEVITTSGEPTGESITDALFGEGKDGCYVGD